MKNFLLSPPPLALSISIAVLLAGSALLLGAQINYSFDDGQLPPGTTISGSARVRDAGAGNKALHLTDAGQFPAFGGFAIPDPAGGNRVRNLRVQWRSLIGGGDNGGADGYSFNWGTDLATAYVGEEGTGTYLSITVDTWDNSPSGEDIGIEIKWRGPDHGSVGVVGTGRIAFLPLLPRQQNLWVVSGSGRLPNV